MIKTKSVFEPKETSDGQRILVSRYWPRNIEPRAVDLWFPELGNRLELIKNWPSGRFNWDYFKNDYLDKLNEPKLQPLLKNLADTASQTTITLLGQARQSKHCHRTLLKDYLDKLLV